MKYVTRIRSRVRQVADLGNEQRRWGLEMYRRRYPVDARICRYEGVVAVNKVEKAFSGNRRHAAKFFAFLLGMDGVTEHEYLLKSERFTDLLGLLGFSSTMRVLRMVADRGHSIHDFVSSHPRVHAATDDPNEVARFLTRTLKYNQENFLRVWPYMNYKKVRNAGNFEEMDRHIRVIGASRVGITPSKVRPAYSPLNRLPSSNLMEFSKDAAVIATVGAETHCCFRKGGLASSLLPAAMGSPIAGIIHGHVPCRWFSFVWEIVENMPGKGVVKNLILDNVEASGTVGRRHSVKIFNALAGLEGFHGVYCGTLRNDVEFPLGVTDGSRPKPYSLVGYESNFARYGSYDDSRNLYTVHEREPSLAAKVRRMSPGDLHRCAYLERMVHRRPDPDFLKDVDVGLSPCYVLESGTNIFGYLTTRRLWFPRRAASPDGPRDPSAYEDEWDFRHGREARGREAGDLWRALYNPEKPDPESHVNVLYLDDVVLCPGPVAMEGLKLIIEHLAGWARSEGVATVVANTNADSGPMVKRVRRAGFRYVEQDGPDYETRDRGEVFGDVRPESVESELATPEERGEDGREEAEE